MENKTFNYTYSAPQREEVKRIREKYLAPAENNLEQLRMLDKKAEAPGRIAAITVGAIGTLLGIGMCGTMVFTQWFAPGIAIGVAGLGLIGAAPVLNRRITKQQRQKLAPEIAALADAIQLAG